ncbi:MAG: hypothetical protein ABI222_11650 [Opitutaceae bacterium]
MSRPPLFSLALNGVVLGWLLISAGAHATIVGLNQIVTPEIQPTGVLGLSAQLQHPDIGNSQQLQFELGLTPKFEVAWFQGLKPGEGLASAEFNFVQQGPHLLTAGVINWSTRGGDAQPVLEYGYYHDADHVVVGTIYAHAQAELLLGYRRQLAEKVALGADFQSGSANSVTAGLIYNFTPDLSINPAVYFTNSQPHHFLGYLVLTWNLTLWK